MQASYYSLLSLIPDLGRHKSAESSFRFFPITQLIVLLMLNIGVNRVTTYHTVVHIDRDVAKLLRLWAMVPSTKVIGFTFGAIIALANLVSACVEGRDHFESRERYGWDWKILDMNRRNLKRHLPLVISLLPGQMLDSRYIRCCAQQDALKIQKSQDGDWTDLLSYRETAAIELLKPQTDVASSKEQKVVCEGQNRGTSTIMLVKHHWCCYVFATIKPSESPKGDRLLEDARK